VYGCGAIQPGGSHDKIVFGRRTDNANRPVSRIGSVCEPKYILFITAGSCLSNRIRRGGKAVIGSDPQSNTSHVTIAC